MANIKFSQFTVGNTESDIDFVVGYKGANNIQISPANLLSATLAGYLPLTGGTMTGGITMVDDVGVLFGTGGDSFIKHTGTQMSMFNDVGHMYFVNRANDRNIYFQSDNGSGGTETYLFLDGNSSKTVLPDNKQIQIGSGGGDAYIYSDGTNMWIQGNNPSADIKLYQGGADGSIRFYSDNGSGGVAEYFAVDGGEEQVRFFKDTEHADSVSAYYGNAGDLKIIHNGTFSSIQNNTGDFKIINYADDKDIIFESDNGSGGTENYIQIDGSAGRTLFNKNIRVNDNVQVQVGGSADLKIYHNGANSYIENDTGDLYIRNNFQDRDIVFQSDDGGGGIATYFQIDGSAEKTMFYKDTQHTDNIKATFGTGADLQIYHDATDSYILNGTGDLEIINNQNDGDIVFKSDDGSGGLATYFLLDGSLADGTNFYTRFLDRSRACFGDSIDLQIFHNGTNSYVENSTGDLLLVNYANDKDIKFFSDDGSGGVTEYFRLDGSNANVSISKQFNWLDSVVASFGNSADIQIFHNGTDSFIDNYTGNLTIRNRQDDADIVFTSDDGSGGLTEYFKLDGSLGINTFYKNLYLPDDVQLRIGTGSDLKIYHDGSNSYIDETGAGNLFIQGESSVFINASTGGSNMASFTKGGAVKLRFNDSNKFETTNTGIKISGVSEYADNTAAIAGGLTTGDVYRTGDLLKIVH